MKILNEKNAATVAKDIDEKPQWYTKNNMRVYGIKPKEDGVAAAAANVSTVNTA